METPFVQHRAPHVPPVHPRPGSLLDGHRNARRTHGGHGTMGQRLARSETCPERLLHRGREPIVRLAILYLPFQPSVHDHARLEGVLRPCRIQQGRVSPHQFRPERGRFLVLRPVGQNVTAEVSEGNLPRPRLPPGLESQVDVPYQVVGLHVLHVILRSVAAASPSVRKVIRHVLYQEACRLPLQRVALIVGQHPLQFHTVLPGTFQGIGKPLPVVLWRTGREGRKQKQQKEVFHRFQHRQTYK